MPVPATPDGKACTNEPVAGLKPSVSNPSNAAWVARIVSRDDGRRLLTGSQWRAKGGAIDRGDRLQRLRAGSAHIPRIGDGAVDDRGGCKQRLAKRNGLSRVGAAQRGAAAQRVGVAVVAGDGHRGCDAAGERGVAIAFKSQRDDNDRIGRSRQRPSRARGAQRRRAGLAERKRSVASEERGFFLAHCLLQNAQSGCSVDVFEALCGRFGFEGHRIFFAKRHVRQRDGDGRIGHARGTLAFRNPAHRIEARTGRGEDRTPMSRVAWVEPRDARQLNFSTA